MIRCTRASAARPALAAGALLGAGAALALATTSALPDAWAQSAPAPAPLTLHELQKGATFTHVRNSPASRGRANRLGDVIAFTNPLTDADGRPAGRLHVQCVTTVGSDDFLKSVLTCIGVLRLRDGDLTIQANTTPGAPTSVGAVTGGTRRYAGARGTFSSRTTASGSDDTILLFG